MRKIYIQMHLRLTKWLNAEDLKCLDTKSRSVATEGRDDKRLTLKKKLDRLRDSRETSYSKREILNLNSKKGDS